MGLGQHWSGNGMVPDGTKPLSEAMFTYHLLDSVTETDLDITQQKVFENYIFETTATSCRGQRVN